MNRPDGMNDKLILHSQLHDCHITRRSLLLGTAGALTTLALPGLASPKRSFSYQNPITEGIRGGIRDAQIVPDGDKYHLVGGMPPFWHGDTPGIRIFTSDNLLSWGNERMLIDRSALDPSVWYYDRFWAPEIHIIRSRYYLLFNARNESKKYHAAHGCAVAVADKVDGPYRVLTQNKPLTGGNDLTFFEDDDGTVYAFWNAQKVIRGSRLDVANMSLVAQQELFYTGPVNAWDSIGIEGAFVIKRNGIYYMFYSSWSRGYEIGYATAKHPLGPWRKHPGNPIYGAQDPELCKRHSTQYTGDPDFPFKAVGHNEVFTGPDGGLWLSCHGIMKRGPHAGTPYLVIDPIRFKHGEIKVDGPTFSPQTVTW